MRRHLAMCSLLMAVAVMLPASAQADRDGYYCIGDTYLAYQLGYAAPSQEPHFLYVVRYGGGAISRPVRFQLPNFAVGGMRCRETGVDLAAFDSIHTVVFGADGFPERRTSSVIAAPEDRPNWNDRTFNLSVWGKAFDTVNTARTSLLREVSREYFLEVAIQPDSIRECDPVAVSRVFEVDDSGREVREQLLQGVQPRPCTRPSYAPIYGTVASGTDTAESLLDALVFGPLGRLDVGVWADPLRSQFAEFLTRFDAYRTARQPVTTAEMRAVDRAWLREERRIYAAAIGVPDDSAASIAGSYVERSKPCYEWEGFHDCPERDAVSADMWLSDHPDGPLSAYLQLVSAHRWLCAAEAYDYEERRTDATRARRNHADRLASALSSKSLLVRAGAQSLIGRGSCFRKTPG